MSFDTLYFLGFLTAALLAFRLLPWRGTVLLAFSIAFYLAAGMRDTILFAAVLAFNYGFSFLVARRSAWFWTAVVADLAVLAFFKYRFFLFGGVDPVGDFGGTIIIPLGISFYTFQIIAYLADIRRGVVKPEPDIRDYLLFIMFFPQLLAGPIMRAGHLLPQLRRIFAGGGRRKILASWGWGLVLLGVFKKVVLADSLAPLVDDIFQNGPADAANAWLGAWLFTFQIYFDFSGYSDMAVGMAYLFGIHLVLNFRQPYLSVGPRDFWQRWHITLSHWIRDYLYIPLGGKHGTLARQLGVLILVWGLAGFWHGANWTFLAWGAAWGLYITAGRLLPRDRTPPALVAWAPHMAMVVMLWVLFRAPDLGFAATYLGAMWGQGTMGDVDYLDGVWQVALVVAGGALLVSSQLAEKRLYDRRVLVHLRRFDGPLLWGLFVGLAGWLLLIPKPNLNPFIYFRF